VQKLDKERRLSGLKLSKEKRPSVWKLRPSELKL